MKFALGLFFLFMTLISCKSQKDKENDRLTDNLKEYFKNNLQDSSAIIDSFLLLKIDTLTQFNKLREQVTYLTNDTEKLLEFFKLNNSKLSVQVSQLKLYEMLESSTLVSIQKEDVNKTIKKGKDISAELDTIQKISKNILSQIAAADTIKAIGFQAKCLYQLRKKDRSVKRDTAYFVLNQNKDIIEFKDWLNIPYSVSFNKFD
jgi:hypothetical protein